MMECLKDESLRVNSRHLAGILFKNTILNTTKDEEWEGVWEKLSDTQQEALKTGSLEALGSSDMNVIRAAASCISAICIMEVPKKKWLEVLNILCTNSNHDALEVRHASLLTLGYICEELMPNELDKNSSDYVITAFLESLELNSSDGDLTKVSIQGIYHSLKFAAENFKNGQGGFIMDKVIEKTQYQNDAVREISMQCIVEVVRMYYDYIEPFMADISEVTIKAAREDETNVKTQAIEVWSSIAEEEQARGDKGLNHSNIIETAFDMLEPMLEDTIQDLNIGNEEWDEEQEWGTSTAAGCCLSLVSQVVKDKVVAPITNFVAENIRITDNWEKRYCGIVALGAILEGPNKANLQEVLNPAVPMLLDLIDDRHPRVRYAICWLFSKIAKSHYQLLTHRDCFPVLFNQLISGLKENSKVAWNVAAIIAELADSILNQGDRIHTCILSDGFEELLNALLDFILRDDFKTEGEASRVRVSGFSAMYNLLQYAPSDCENVSVNFMGHIIEMLKSSVKADYQLSAKQLELQGFFFWALQWILTNVQRDLDEGICIEISQLIVDVFNQREDIFDEAFLALSAVANKFPNALNQKVDEIAPFLTFGLDSKNAAIIRNSWGVLSDLCTLVESPAIIEGFKIYMPILLGHLKDEQTEKSVKIIIISLIGDTFLFAKHKFEPFLEESLNILETAAGFAVRYPISYYEDFEMQQYIAQLQSSLVECYTCFVQNINEAGDKCYQTLGGFIYNIFTFLTSTIDDNVQPDLVSSLGLILIANI